jgi:hypothetical protein
MSTSGVVSGSVLGMVLAGAFGGAVAGLIISALTSNVAVIAWLAALAAGAVALLISPILLGPEVRLMHSPVGVWNLLIASIIGAFAGHELAVDIRTPPVPTLIGAASGAFAAIVMASLLVTIVWVKNQPDHTKPGLR